MFIYSVNGIFANYRSEVFMNFQTFLTEHIYKSEQGFFICISYFFDGKSRSETYKMRIQL